MMMQYTVQQSCIQHHDIAANGATKSLSIPYNAPLVAVYNVILSRPFPLMYADSTGALILCASRLDKLMHVLLL